MRNMRKMKPKKWTPEVIIAALETVAVESTVDTVAWRLLETIKIIKKEMKGGK